MSADDSLPADAPKKNESVLGIMDDLLSHLNRTKKFFMALVISSFVVAPLAIVLSILMLTPQFLTGVGQQQDVVFSPKTTFSKVVSPAGEGPLAGEPAMITVRIMPGNEIKSYNITGLKQLDRGSFVVDKSQINVEYVPANIVKFEAAQLQPAMPPRFMYVSSAPAAAPFDVTWVIVAVIAISATVAGAWLLIGIKEYRFFSHWNSRYANYKAMQEKVDKELDGSTTG